MLGSTYRLQLHGLGLVGATKIVPYLERVGHRDALPLALPGRGPGQHAWLRRGRPGAHRPRGRLGRGLPGPAGRTGSTAACMPCSTSCRTTWRPTRPTRGGGTCWRVARRRRTPWSLTSIGVATAGACSCPRSAAPWPRSWRKEAARSRTGCSRSTASRFPWPPGRRPGPLARWSWRPSTSGPAYWRTGDTEGNYRRFFDIGSLIGVRVEDPDVFARTHAYILELCRHPAVAGLRVDHVDGLADPRAYLVRLRRHLEQAGSGQGRAGREDPCPRRVARSALAGGGHDGLRVRRPRHGPVPRAGRLCPPARTRFGVGPRHRSRRSRPWPTRGSERCLTQSFSGDLDRLTRLHARRARSTRCQGTTCPRATCDGPGPSSRCIFRSTGRIWTTAGRRPATGSASSAAAAAATAHGGPGGAPRRGHDHAGAARTGGRRGPLAARWPGAGSSSAGPSWPRASRTRPPTARPACRCGPTSAAIRTKGVIRSRRSIGWSPHAPEASTPHPPTTRSATRTPGAGWPSCRRRTASGRRSCATGTGCSRHPATACGSDRGAHRLPVALGPVAPTAGRPGPGHGGTRQGLRGQGGAGSEVAHVVD